MSHTLSKKKKKLHADFQLRGVGAPNLYVVQESTASYVRDRTEEGEDEVGIKPLCPMGIPSTDLGLGGCNQRKEPSNFR